MGCVLVLGRFLDSFPIDPFQTAALRRQGAKASNQWLGMLPTAPFQATGLAGAVVLRQIVIALVADGNILLALRSIDATNREIGTGS
jgi:hypothetical protein